MKTGGPVLTVSRAHAVCPMELTILVPRLYLFREDVPVAWQLAKERLPDF